MLIPYIQGETEHDGLRKIKHLGDMKKERAHHNYSANKLITVLFATESNPQFCALLKTAILNGQNVHIVGWNMKHSDKGKVIYNGKSIEDRCA